ncbi:MAG: cytochrome C biogenesis protein [Opitutus sp.]|nr:cytochrome C biogenesis protein [Opitutus sp.]
MKRFLPLFFLLLGLALIAKSLVPVRNSSDFDLVAFGRLPVVVNGRVKPLDTVARTSLVVLQSSQNVTAPDGTALTPNEWLLDVLFRSSRADAYQHFEINHPDLLAIFGLTPEAGRAKRRFSFRQLESKIDELQRQAKLAASVESAVRTPFQKAVVQLYANVGLYFRLKASLVSPDHKDFLAELMVFQNSVVAGVSAVRAKQAGQPHDEALAAQMMEAGGRFARMGELAYLLSVPPTDGEANTAGWKKVGDSLLETFQTGRVPPAVMVFAGLARMWTSGQAKEFNEVLRLYRAQLEKNFPTVLGKSDAEARFNAVQPFYTATLLYVLAFILAVISWLRWPAELGRAAFWLVGLAWLLATAGIFARMWLEGRPPVTNLYSSALFVGWIAVGFCLGLEYFYRNAIGSVAAGLVGFATLLVAHHLSLGGDTLEMMRAVLDSNFWLATHVVTVTAGYGATFLAGFLGLIYIVRGVFTKSLDPGTADALSRMIYGIVCFATLFSLVGTILGGIWADQSWGRFWGWDPKENGALMIVIWNALLLHARWGGLARQRGLAALAVFGNIITSWSWFGVNMLGVGLHSYGFMDAAFWWLLAFVTCQLVFIVVASLPLAKWRSFRSA